MNNDLLHNELSDDQMNDVMGGNPAHGAVEESIKRLEQIKQDLKNRQATQDITVEEPGLDSKELTEDEMLEVRAGVPKR